MLKSLNAVHVLFLALLIAYLHSPAQSDNSIYNQLNPTHDECMFFAPTVLALAVLQRPSVSSRDPTSSSSLYSLWLSLESSLDLLLVGVDTDKRLIVDHPDLQDNFTAYWGAQIIASVLKAYIMQNRINTILTFDREGISGDLNKSLPAGAKALMSTLTEVRLFTLITTPVLPKYSGILAPSLAKFDLYASALLHFLEAQLLVARVLTALNIYVPPAGPTPTTPRPEVMPVFVSRIKEHWAAVQAMRTHTSQMVWFRWLYVLFSRYMWVNEWNEVRVV
ncbi:hypothetical protein K438DRAFT_1859370 [Mycena galopus ATCC 62051]|nr:hypothetical protein K438DRAFT_1859370 [Mycena galopus ATCC 62051]